jgi:hypothetical protein
MMSSMLRLGSGSWSRRTRGGLGAALGWAAGAGAAGHVATPELPRVGQRELVPQDTWRPRAGQRELEPQDTWRPRSCLGLGSGSWCRRTRGGPGLGSGSWSRRTRGGPGAVWFMLRLWTRGNV